MKIENVEQHELNATELEKVSGGTLDEETFNAILMAIYNKDEATAKTLLGGARKAMSEAQRAALEYYYFKQFGGLPY